MTDEDALLAEVASFLGGTEPDTDVPEPLLHPASSLELEEVDTEALLSSLDSSTVSSTRALPSPKAPRAGLAKKKKAARPRRRPKDDLDSLRLQEMQLEAELDALKKEKANAQTAGRGAANTDGSGVALSAWRLIAIRQKQDRIEAETQQKRLQTAISSRKELIQDLERVMRKRVYRDHLGYDNDLGIFFSEKRARLGPDDTTLFETYLQELNTMYHRTDEVFRACGMPVTLAKNKSFNPLHKRDGDTEYFEEKDVLRVPFGTQETSDAVWELLSFARHHSDRQPYDGLGDQENTVAMKFRMHCHREGCAGMTGLAHFVARRYVEAKRTVIVWRCLMEAEGELRGMHSDDTGWATTEPLVDTRSKSGSDSNAPSTLIKLCLRFVPMRFDAGRSRGEDDGARKTEKFRAMLTDLFQIIDEEITDKMASLRVEDGSSTD